MTPNASSRNELSESRDESPSSLSARWQQGEQAVDKAGFAMLVVCLISMALTIITTWPLWQARVDPPNLPVLSGANGPSFGVLLLISLVFAMIRPRNGLLLHFAVLFVALLFDQIRCQPQIFALPVLMAACVWPSMRPIGRWFLIAMWLWAGIHKLVSPYWLGPSSWYLLDRMGFESAMDLYLPFAFGVAIGEVVLALLAIWKPRWAAPFCVALHLGIVGMLLSINWNFSVLYWNIALSIVGTWLIWTWGSEARAERKQTPAMGARLWPERRWQRVVVVLLVVTPAGVYNGLTPHFVAHVLYSDHMPRGLISGEDGATDISTWDSLHVPVPRVRRMLKEYFLAAAEPGEKLHILDSRRALDDQFLIKTQTGLAREIKRDEFFRGVGASQIQGIAKDYAPAVFALQKAGVRMLKKTEKGMIYAVEFHPENYDVELLPHVRMLQNLEEIQMAGCAVEDSHLQHMMGLQVLVGIGLDSTLVTDDCLEYLRDLPRLRHVEYDGTDLSEERVREMLGQAP